MKPTILVTDDEQDYRNLVTLALTPSYDVCEARNGLDALSQLNNKPVDLVLIDINMPDMDGFTVCKKIRENPAFQHIPVIMLTVRTSSNAQTKGLDSGADDYITKPFNQEELRARIKSLLSRSRPVPPSGGQS
ncbi:MAG: response regulator [Elusimicrobia bacterium]|nr:response regulator [Elusimicrobiota bacterium]MBD3411713.1 response regulator [Elusimicrobiota bacterium]